MTFEELLDALREAKREESRHDPESSHADADDALVRYVEESLTPEQRVVFRGAWDDLTKWYA